MHRAVQEVNGVLKLWLLVVIVKVGIDFYCRFVSACYPSAENLTHRSCYQRVPSTPLASCVYAGSALIIWIKRESVHSR